MNFRAAFLIVFFLWSSICQSQNLAIEFDVTLNGKKIGTLKATEETNGHKLVRDLRTSTDAKVLVLAVHVESEINLIQENGSLLNSTAYRHSNRGSEDVHSTVVKKAEKSYEVDRNGKKNKIQDIDISFCVIDLYFKEPTGISKIFSTMYGAFLEIKNIGTSQYMVVTPDKKNSYYTYTAGKLTTIEVDTAVGKVKSVRKGT